MEVPDLERIFGKYFPSEQAMKQYVGREEEGEGREERGRGGGEGREGEGRRGKGEGRGEARGSSRFGEDFWEVLPQRTGHEIVCGKGGGERKEREEYKD